MATPTTRAPKYRHYKPKDLAVVRLDGQDDYLGKYGSEASREKYRRVVAEWPTRATPKLTLSTTPAAGQEPTVNVLILALWTRHAASNYRHPDGSPTGELDNYRDSLRPLRRLYGLTRAGDFGPSALKLVREEMIRANLARTTINQRIGRIVRVFRWGVEDEMIPPALLQALRAVAGLQCGRSEARESLPYARSQTRPSTRHARS
ncbi:MAG: site-specific tyrosine recombinase XerC [Planctomycetota bacterium]|nr:site-specific tyrosine recombinase XerC [Planctomycetota bacterium]